MVTLAACYKRSIRCLLLYLSHDGSVHGTVSADGSVKVDPISSVTFKGNVVVTADANGSHVGTVVANGNSAHVATVNFGHASASVLGIVHADAFIHASGLDSLTFDGAVTVTADANGNHVGDVTANGNYARVAVASYFGFTS